MDVALVLTVVAIFGAIIFLLSMGIWVGLAIGAVGISLVIGVVKMPEIIGPIIYNSLSSYVLSAIPMFVFMGEIIQQTGFSGRLYEGVSKWTRVLPGGLVHTNIFSCAFFAAINGSSVATAAAIGTVAYPEQEKRGYNKRLVLGSLAAGGTLGPMIPPSMAMILYGAFVNEPVGKLFIGTAIPGVLMAIMFMIYIYIRFRLDPSLGPKSERITLSYFGNAVRAWVDVWPIALLALIIFVSIYGGFMTPTEAAAISAFVALCIALAFRRLTFNALKGAALKAIDITALCFLIIISAKILATALAMLMIPKQLAAMAGVSGLHPMLIWTLIIVMYLILGCFMDGLSMLFLTLAVVYPLMMSLGFDGIWLGVTVMKVIECGQLTPPVGMNLYVIQGISKQPFEEVVKGSFPFFLLLLGLIVLCTAFPQLALWLPGTM
jgi:tripartite ATP-independent transporter DctM subunit